MHNMFYRWVLTQSVSTHEEPVAGSKVDGLITIAEVEASTRCYKVNKLDNRSSRLGERKKLTLRGIPLQTVLWRNRTELGPQNSLNLGVGQGIGIPDSTKVSPALGLELGVQKTEDCRGSQKNGEDRDRLHIGNA